MKFGRIDLTKTTYSVTLEAHLLNPVPIDEINRVYKQYCLYKNFKSIMPMIPGRFLIPNTEVFGYYEQEKLIAWSMYRIWDKENIVIDHHAWDYNNPKLRIGYVVYKLSVLCIEIEAIDLCILNRLNPIC